MACKFAVRVKWKWNLVSRSNIYQFVESFKILLRPLLFWVTFRMRIRSAPAKEYEVEFVSGIGISRVHAGHTQWAAAATLETWGLLRPVVGLWRRRVGPHEQLAAARERRERLRVLRTAARHAAAWRAATQVRWFLLLLIRLLHPHRFALLWPQVAQTSRNSCCH